MFLVLQLFFLAKESCAQLAYTLAYKDSLQSNWDSVVVTNNGNNLQAHSLSV